MSERKVVNMRFNPFWLAGGLILLMALVKFIRSQKVDVALSWFGVPDLPVGVGPATILVLLIAAYTVPSINNTAGKICKLLAFGALLFAFLQSGLWIATVNGYQQFKRWALNETSSENYWGSNEIVYLSEDGQRVTGFIHVNGTTFDLTFGRAGCVLTYTPASRLTLTATGPEPDLWRQGRLTPRSGERVEATVWAECS